MLLPVYQLVRVVGRYKVDQLFRETLAQDLTIFIFTLLRKSDITTDFSCYVDHHSNMIRLTLFARHDSTIVKELWQGCLLLVNYLDSSLL